MRRGLTSLSNAIPTPDETKELLDEDSFIARRVQERMMRTVGIDMGNGKDFTAVFKHGIGVITDEMQGWVAKLDEVFDFFETLRVSVKKTAAGSYELRPPIITVDSLSKVNKEFENASYRRHQQRWLCKERGSPRDWFPAREPEGWRRVS